MSETEKLAALVARLEAAVAKLEGAGGAGGAAAAPAAGADGGSPKVAAWDALMAGPLQAFLAASEGTGSDEVKKQAAEFAKLFALEKTLIEVASKSKKPDMKVVQELWAPAQKIAKDVAWLADKRSSWFNHTKAVAEGQNVLMWFFMEPTPVPFIKETIPSAEFYTNKVRVEFKKKDEKQIAWVVSFVDLLKGVMAYVKDHHTTGLSWNPKGGDAKEAAASSGGAAKPAKPAGGGAPPPPGPPPPPAPEAAPASSGADSGALAANLFAEINKGGDITKGLKKVTKDMKTKNRTDRSSVVPAGAAKKPAATAPKKAAAAPKRPPRTELTGKKWNVEYHDGNSAVEVEASSPKQGVYIFKCTNSVVKIKGKVNNIVLDGCKKTAVVFDSCIASFEIVNCTSCKVQILDKTPTVSIDKTDGIIVYVSKASLDTVFVTSKSSEMNIVLPAKEENGDWTEHAVPEQYITKIVDGTKIVTQISSHV